MSTVTIHGELFSIAGQTIFQHYAADGGIEMRFSSYPKDGLLPNGQFDPEERIARYIEEYESEQEQLRRVPVLFERERCAKLAESIATQYDPKGWDGEADSYQTANLIAAEIRKGE